MNTVRICSTLKRVQNAVRASVKNGIHLAAFHWGRGEESRLQSLHSGQGISSPCPLLYLALVGVICFQIKKERPVGRSSKFMLATKQCLLSLTRLVVKLTVFVLYRGFGGTPPSNLPLLPSTREQSNKRSGTRLKPESETGERRYGRVRLARALPISLLIFRRKKPDCFAV